MSQPTIESILHEKRLFHPSEDFSKQARIKSMEEYRELYEKAKANPEAFWAELAENELHWFKKWDQVLDWQPPFAKWFVGGKINISYNCLDRHLTTWRKNKAALIWEGEPGDSRTLTYSQLHREVCQMANVIKQLGVKKGDRVGIYMPMIPEAAIAMLACARIGAPHTVIFGGFSAEALKDRLEDAQAKLVITADGGWRKDAIVPLKEQVDKALQAGAPSVDNVLVVQRTQQKSRWNPDGTTGGMTCNKMLPGNVPPKKWIVRICCLSFTLAGLLVNPRELYTLLVAIIFTVTLLISGLLIYRILMFTGVPLMWVGLLAIVILSMGLCPMGPQL
ncbi:Acetyl-coenzyme A synthetase N-terminus [Limnospira platensis C1]|nr:Acetyl-coenzyme A synthetase N-terminus [Arthrospira platensis C1]